MVFRLARLVAALVLFDLGRAALVGPVPVVEVNLHYRHRQLLAVHASALAGHVGAPVTILAGDARVEALPGDSPDDVMARHGIPPVSTAQLPEDVPTPGPTGPADPDR